jgi:hypothetical protein
MSGYFLVEYILSITPDSRPTRLTNASANEAGAEYLQALKSENFQ